MLDLLNEINELNQNKYKIYDFSNRNFQQLCKSVELCQKITNIIVYIERNTENNDFFELHENMNRSETKSYIDTQIIIFHIIILTLLKKIIVLILIKKEND